MTKIEPAEPIEETLKYKGKLRRTTIARHSYAECLNCDQAWDGVGAIGGSSNHAIGSGHQVVQHYQAAYVLSPTIKKIDSLTIEHDPEVIAKQLRSLVDQSKVTPS